MSAIQSTRRQMRSNETIETKDFIARPYQIELYEVCKSRNTIVCLNTGCGKTFIAVMLIRHLSPKCLSENKRIFFLVPLVPLVSQQSNVIETHTDLRVGQYCGSAFDNWTKDNWNQELDKYDVFVMIDEIFRRILYQGFISLSQICLLVIDEAHRAVGDHPYREILRMFDSCALENQPRILGLSASLISNNASPQSIQSLIQKLEQTMRSVCETASDLRTINKYAAKPTEEVIEYESFNMKVSDNIKILKLISDNLLTFLEDVDFDSLQIQKNTINIKSLCKSIKDTLFILTSMGVWCAKQVCRLYIRELSDTIEMLSSSKSHYTAFLSAVLTALNVIEVQLSALLKGLSPRQRLLDYTSPKLLYLSKLLKSYNTSESVSTSNPLCGIIFVERRSVARILCLWLQELAKLEVNEFSHLKADYVLGHGGGGGTSSLSLMSSRKQEESLKKFRSHECNVLVATSVLEEGLDVPRCNHVIRYDPPKTFREYIQSKGRARAEKGKYILFIEKNEFYAKTTENLAKFRETEAILNESCHQRTTPTEAEIEQSFDDQMVAPYVANDSESSGRVNLNSAIAIINRYCLKLPSDSFTKLTPHFTIEEQTDGRYVCRLRLPINSQIRQEIVSNSMPTKLIAKKAAALKACEVLHKKKELDDNFLPVGKEAMDFIKELGLEPPDDEIERVERGPRPGTTKRRQYYTKLVAEVLNKNPIESNTNCFLYEFAMKLSKPIPEEQNTRGRKITDPADTTKNFGILTPQKVPPICDFPVFTRSGEVTVKLESVREDIVLTKEQIEELSVFHKFTFSEVLRLIKYPLQFDPQKANSKHFVVPIECSESGRKDIDWDFVKRIKQHKESPPDSSSPEERKNFEFDANLYNDAVVIPWYRKDKPQFFFYVAEICHNLSPKSPFPDEGYETFEKYYSGKYEIEIMNSNQPLLDVDHTSARLNLLTPRYVNRRGISLPASTAKTKKEKRENLQQKQILIPELCNVHPFPASFWRKAVCLPCLLFRINSLLVAEQLRCKVAKESSIGIIQLRDDMSWPPLDFGWIVSQEEDTNEEISQNQLVCSKPPQEPVQEEWDFEDEATDIVPEENVENSAETGEQELVIDTFDPSHYVITDALDDEDFDNDFFDEEMNFEIPINIIGGPNGFSSTTIPRNWGFNPLNTQNGVQIREITENDDLAEDDRLVRVGSPSLFNISVPTVNEGREWDIAEATTVFPIGSSVPQLEFIQSTTDLNIEGLTRDLANFPVEEFDSFDGSTDMEDIYSDEEDGDEEIYSSNVCKSSGISNNKSRNKIADILKYELFVDSNNNCNQRKDPNEKTIEKLYKSIKRIKVEQNDENVIEITQNTNSNCVDSHPNEDTNENHSELLRLFGPYLRDEDDVCNQFSDLSDDEAEDNSEPQIESLCDQINPNIEFSEDVKTEDSVGFGDLLPERDINEISGKPFIENFDPLKSDVDKEGPSPAMVLQALTMSNASDGINLERLETVGDSFLKYAVTAFLYCVCPGIHEGRLSYLRSRQISNMNLYRLGKKIGVGEFMSATKFEPNDNWCPPCYAIPEGLEKALIESNGDNESTVYDIGRFEDLNSLNAEQIMNQIKDLSIESKNSENSKKRAQPSSGLTIPYNLLTQHSIPDKSIADCVEALIGAYLISSGPRGALLFMKWLGLKVMPNHDVNNDDTDDLIWHWLPTPKSPLLLPYEDISGENHNLNKAKTDLNILYEGHNLKEFEDKIGYVFKDKAYLVQAFTHNSFYENQVTDCYQRLEFLGDAVLDYLITRYLYEDPAAHSPGTLTDLRSALVNNTFFASLSVKYKFYTQLKFISFELFRVVMAFVNKFKQNRGPTNDLNLFIVEGESENPEDIEVPKALGDIFESVAGAIFLDSGMSLDAVWKVYYKMMKPEIEYFSSHVPKSPIRELLEMEPQNAKFGKPELISGRKIRVCVEVFDFGKFVGIGRNKRIAKCTAAKRALRALKSRQRQ